MVGHDVSLSMLLVCLLVWTLLTAVNHPCSSAPGAPSSACCRGAGTGSGEH